MLCSSILDGESAGKKLCVDWKALKMQEKKVLCFKYFYEETEQKFSVTKWKLSLLSLVFMYIYIWCWFLGGMEAYYVRKLAWLSRFWGNDWSHSKLFYFPTISIELQATIPTKHKAWSYDAFP